MKKQSYKDIAYEIIKEKIVSCELLPGDIVDKNVLMKEIGVGLTPVREAINKLEQDDLVVIMPRRGVVVSNVSINDISCIYSVRELVEPYMAREAVPNMQEEDLRWYMKQFQSYIEKDMVEQTNLDSKFHLYIAGNTRNKYLVKMMDNIYLQNQRIRILTSKVPQRLRDSSQEHIEIIDMFLKKDADGVEQAMRKHIASAKDAAAHIV